MSNRVSVRFHAGLDNLVALRRRGGSVSLEVAAGTTVKDLVESLGVPHTEIDVILVNGESVGFEHRVDDGDRIAVYPMSEVPAVVPLIRLTPTPLREPRFVLDVHLGRLARSLRLLGFDSVWGNDLADAELAAISVGEARVLLTRDRGLLKRAKVIHGYLVRETDPHRQIIEVLRRFDLFGAIDPFGRCLQCNGVLEPVAKEEVEHRLPLRTRQDHDEFRTCPDCGRIYWQGSHYDQLATLVEDVRQAGTVTSHSEDADTQRS